MRLTLDTGVLPIDDLLDCFRRNSWSGQVISVTHREVEGSSFAHTAFGHSKTPETGVWGESRWDEAVWGTEHDAEQLERIIVIVSNGSFPSDRSSLTSGERHQLRDALIFQTHLRSGADAFVTSDERAFIRNGRRRALQDEFKTRILTRDELVSLCAP